MSFGEIVFGKTSGEEEAAELPKLITDGYFDSGTLAKFLSREKWLVLGRKGSGKSILGEKLKSLAESSSDGSAVRLVHLADFPYRTFSQLIPNSIEASTRYPASWSWLLSLMLLDCLHEHPGSVKSKNVEADAAVGLLQGAGLLPILDLQKLVVLSSKGALRAQLPHLLEHIAEPSAIRATKDLAFLNLTEALKRLVQTYSFSGQQFLVIDGLDDILTNHDIQYETLSALIFEAQRLNSFFKTKRVPISIVVLCRTDLYEVLPGPNKNKIRHDLAVEIDWYRTRSKSENSSLVQLANLRASLSLGEPVDIFTKFLPRTLRSGQVVLKYLTDLTRHTPRDFLTLLTHIQAAQVDEPDGRASVIDGAKTYSEQYFLPEIKDELVGYTEAGDLNIFLNCVGEIHERQFTTARLASAAEAFGLPRRRLEILLHALFAASAIGMSWREGNKERFEFKYRNPHAVFNPRRTILLHKGMWKALNLA